MKLITFVLVFSIVCGAARAQSDVLLYDVDFSSPPHLVGQPPTLGNGDAPRLKPTRINFGDPTVVDAFAPLMDQPCELGNGTDGYDQLQFTIGANYGGGFDDAYDAYRIELDVVIDSLGAGNADTLTLLHDLPTVHNVHFEPDGDIRVFIPGEPSQVVAQYVRGEKIAVRVELDVICQVWEIWIDGAQVLSESVPDCERLRAFRVNLIGLETDDSAAIDNVRIWGTTGDSCATVPCGLLESLTASDGNVGNEFGIRMATFEDTLLVGAFRDDEGGADSGAVYAYHRDDAGTPFDPLDDSWIEISKIVPDAPIANEIFGTRMGIYEDRVVVGAREKVYFFVREDGGTPLDPLDDSWVQVFIAFPPEPTFEFSVGLALWEDTVVVGTENERAWIYERLDSGTPDDPFDDTWTVTKSLDMRPSGNRFAWSLSMHGDTILFGARRADVDGKVDAGAAFVYDRDDMGTPEDKLDDDWIETAFLTTETLNTGTHFGREVWLDGDTAVLGAWRALDYSGLAYIFERDRMSTPDDPTDDAWVETAILAPSDGEPGDRFGVGVGLDGDVAVVGAHFHDLDEAAAIMQRAVQQGGSSSAVDIGNAGAAYVYERDDAGTPNDPFDDSWPETAKLVDPDPSVEGHFGIWPVADGRTVFAGTPSLPGFEEGSMHAFDIVCPDVILSFESEDDFLTPLVNGQDVSSAEEFGVLVGIDGSSAFGLPAAVFDSDPEGPNSALWDPDLLVDQGNVLILQESPLQSVPGFFDVPDDERAGGELLISFLGGTVRPVSVDLIDIDLLPEQTATVVLVDVALRTRTYTAPSGWTEDISIDGPPGLRTLDLQTLDPQPGFAATATATEDPGFDSESVILMTVDFGGSAALDNLRFEQMTSLPARVRRPPPRKADVTLEVSSIRAALR